MSNVMDKIIEDLVKGAQASKAAFVRGGSVNVEIQRDRGHETKLANHAALGGALAGPLGAAIGADPGQRMQAAGGSLLGGMGGGLAGGMGGAGLGALIGALLKNPELGASLGSGIGGLGGSIAGSAYGAHKATEKESSLHGDFAEGVKAACATFGIKEAFLPLLGAIAGPMLARAGVGALARGAGGKMLGGIAGKVAPRIAGGMGGAAFDMAASSAGQGVGQKMMPQQPQM